MSKLAAAILSHFIVVPYIEASPASTPVLLPDSALTSLAGRAPAVCSQLQRIGRYPAFNRDRGPVSVFGLRLHWKL